TRRSSDLLARRPRGLDEQVAPEGGLGDLLRGLEVAEGDAGEQAAATDLAALGQTGEDLEALVELLRPGRDVLLQGVVGPEGAQGLGPGDEGRVVSAEGAVVLTGLPVVDLGLHQRQRHGEPVAGDRLAQGDDVGVEADRLAGAEVAGATAAGLDVVDDEQDPGLPAQLLARLVPLSARGPEAALSLDARADDPGGQIASGPAVAPDAAAPGEVRAL